MKLPPFPRAPATPNRDETRTTRWRGSASRTACSPAPLDAPCTFRGRSGSSSTHAVRVRSRPTVPSCPVPRTSSRSEDDIVLHDGLERVVPLDQALVPVNGLRGGPVLQRALLERAEDLLGAVLGGNAGAVFQPVADLLKADPIGA